MATWEQRVAVSPSIQVLPPNLDEFKLAEHGKLSSRIVKPMRVNGSPIHLEYWYVNSLRFPGNGPTSNADAAFRLHVGRFIKPEIRGD
jgi:hypothetical protein